MRFLIPKSMQTSRSSRKFSHSVLATALAIIITCGLSLRTAQAGYIVTLQQVGANVVATGSGPIDLTGLSFLGTALNVAGMAPLAGLIETGPAKAFVFSD